MVKNQTTRSSNDGKAWRCRCGNLNKPTKHRFFNLPAFQCTNCGSKLSLDFKFCLGEIEVGGKSLTGEVRDQEKSPYCVAFAYSKAAEVTERVFNVRNDADPDSVVSIDPFALEERFVKKFPSLSSHDALTHDRGVHKVLHMGLILRAEGCRRVGPEDFENNDEPYKAPDVCTVPCDSFEEVCKELAEGTPFVGTYLAGKRRNKLPYCKIYKSPRLAAIKAKKAKHIGHAVVIIGAGMKKGKKYFYFLNSWGKKFCPRKNKKGETVKGGIGKLRVEDLTKNLVKLSPPDQIGGERSLQHQSEYAINEVNYILMMAEEKQYSAKMVQRLREKANSEFVPSAHVDDGVFRDDEGGVCPQTCCVKSQALKVIKKLIEHFPIKRAPLRVRFTARKLNFTSLMERVAEQNATVISKDDSGTQPSIVCEIEPSVLHSGEERLKDVQGTVEVQQAVPAKGPDTVAQMSETMQKRSISTESQGNAQGKQQRRCKECDVLVEDKLYREHCQSGWHKHNYTRHKNGLPPLSQEECMAFKVIKKLIEHFSIKHAPLMVRFTAPKLNFTGLMEKVDEQNATVISKDESGTQPSIVCEIEPSILHACEERLKDVQGRVEVRSVSAHAEGGPSVEQHDSVEVPQAAPAKGPDAVAQISERMQKQSISTESQGSPQGKQQRRCKECDVLVEDKLYREHSQSGWHKHNYTRHKNRLPPLSQEECMVEIELAGSKEDLKDYDF